MSDEPGATEEASDPERTPLDVFVFAPVGLAVTVAEELPELIDKGRRRVELQFSNARVVGKIFLAAGQREVAARLTQLVHREATDRSDTGPAPQDSAAPAAPPAAAPKPAPDPADRTLVERAFAGYDTLSASQVVRRLESLDADHLHAVQRYEASHRNRRTILSRAQQLLEGAPAAPPPQVNGSTP